ncbi:hypothetical protein ACWD6R_35980 [Streptomyces sp. NPDC005151]
MADARPKAAMLGPLIGDERPATIADARALIDRVDAAPAPLCERYAELAGAIGRWAHLVGGSRPGQVFSHIRADVERPGVCTIRHSSGSRWDHPDVQPMTELCRGP